MVQIRNDAQGARTIRMKDRSYRLVDAGATVDVRGGDIFRLAPGLVEVSQVPPMPKRLAAKAAAPKRDSFDHDGDGKPGGSRKGRASTAAKGARRRRRKAATK